jgi:ribosomal-protein-alanine N-acetyltransferase
MQLRLLTDNDDTIARVHALLCVPDVYKYLADGIEPPRAIAEAWVKASEYDFGQYGGGLWAIELSDLSVRHDDILGLVRLGDYSNKGLELTYLLHPDIWGKGYATLMAQAAINECFARGKVDKIWAGADVPNKASINVMKRLNMQFVREVDYPAGKGVEYELYQ